MKQFENLEEQSETNYWSLGLYQNDFSVENWKMWIFYKLKTKR